MTGRMAMAATASVVIAVHTPQRPAELTRATESVLGQRSPGREWLAEPTGPLARPYGAG